MGTENTASTILQGAQLTAQANAGLSQAIVQGFGQLQTAIKFKSDLYNQMIQSTQDARKIDIDEWYKRKSLELNDRQLSIMENHYAADIDYKNAILDREQKNSARVASTAPLNAAIATGIKEIDRQYNDLSKIENGLYSELTGDTMDNNGNWVSSGKLGLGEWDDGYNEKKSQLEEIKSKKLELKNRADTLTKANQRIQMGDDPASVYRDTFPEETFTPRDNNINKQQPRSSPQIKMDRTTPMFNDTGIPWRDYTPGSSNTDPLLPSINQKDEKNDQGNPATRELVGKLNTQNHLSPDPNADYSEPDPYANESDTLYTKPKIYKPGVAHELDVNKLINFSEKNKTEFDYITALSSLSKTTPEYQQKTLLQQKQIQIDAFRSIGDKFSQSVIKPETKEVNLKLIGEEVDRYKKLMMKASGDPNLIDVVANKADLSLVELRRQPEYDSLKETDGNVPALEKFTNNFLGQNAEGILFGTKKEEQIKVGGLTDDLVKIKTSSPSLFAPNGSVKVTSKYGESDKPKIDNNYINLRNQFDKEFKNEPSKENPLPVSKDYVSWINSLDKPEDFGIDTSKTKINELKNPSFSNYSGFTDSSGSNKRDSDTVKQLIINRKREIVNDPDRAFYFWLDKKKRDQVKDMPEFQKYLKENVN